MKLAHFIELRVFSKEDDDEAMIVSRLNELAPIDHVKDKLPLKSKISLGFDDKKIKIITVHLTKERHTSAVLSNLNKKLSDEQKELLLKQLESRLDHNLHFFIRLDKDKLIEGTYWITDGGNCFHMKIALAAYPHKREIAKKMLTEYLSISI